MKDAFRSPEFWRGALRGWLIAYVFWVPVVVVLYVLGWWRP